MVYKKKKKKKRDLWSAQQSFSLLSEISINLSFSFHNDIIENGTTGCNAVEKFLKIIKLIKFKPNLNFPAHPRNQS